jgi:hypothetical protein
MGGKAKIIVAAERGVLAAIDRNAAALRRLQQASLAFQPPELQFLEFRRKRLLEC